MWLLMWFLWNWSLQEYYFKYVVIDVICLELKWARKLFIVVCIGFTWTPKSINHFLPPWNNWRTGKLMFSLNWLLMSGEWAREVGLPCRLEESTCLLLWNATNVSYLCRFWRFSLNMLLFLHCSVKLFLMKVYNYFVVNLINIVVLDNKKWRKMMMYPIKIVERWFVELSFGHGFGNNSIQAVSMPHILEIQSCVKNWKGSVMPIDLKGSHISIFLVVVAKGDFYVQERCGRYIKLSNCYLSVKSMIFPLMIS